MHGIKTLDTRECDDQNKGKNNEEPRDAVANQFETFTLQASMRSERTRVNMIFLEMILPLVPVAICSLLRTMKR